ncbi:hypothetical protein STEG23_006524, partial [Scotinomys teguina]
TTALKWKPSSVIDDFSFYVQVGNSERDFSPRAPSQTSKSSENSRHSVPYSDQLLPGGAREHLV